MLASVSPRDELVLQKKVYFPKTVNSVVFSVEFLILQSVWLIVSDVGNKKFHQACLMKGTFFIFTLFCDILFLRNRV